LKTVTSSPPQGSLNLGPFYHDITEAVVFCTGCSVQQLMCSELGRCYLTVAVENSICAVSQVTCNTARILVMRLN
jgi:hypothetical protein